MCSTGRKQEVTGPQFTHGQTASMFGGWESRRSYAAAFRQ